MPSLQEFNISDCKSLEYFPKVVGNMDPLMYINAEGSAINELPSSIGNLPRLRSLNLRSCRNLRGLPNSLLTLHNLGVLLLGDIKPHGRKSLKKLMQESQPPTISCTNLDRLELQNCGLLDDLHLILKCFRNVRYLNLSRNDFVSLPECIKECAYLERLDLSACKRLRDIPELPLTLQSIAADKCMSLTLESIRHLWSQAKEGFRVEIVMPAISFPDWLHFCCKGGKLSFRVRGNFPHVLIAYKTGKANTSGIYTLEVFMRINGSKKMPWVQSDRDAREKGRFVLSVGYQAHVFFYDLLSDFSEEELEELNKFLDLEWNDVDIQVTSDSPADMSIINCGIYVNKQQTSMENVQFKSPLRSMNASRASLKRRAVASHPNEPPKKHLRRFKEKINCTRRTRQPKPHRIFHSQCKRRMFFPMSKHLLRALYS
ncbi:disease resistance protein RML1B-like [Neltuma alba]|uniref:disease resistance protein RML1B-like n=1 Tax=Neltuma alba TaxID=207710 RepID=UPI0010A4CDAD|nr:disease resistance protein RML1B-like [Prosopis alba]